LVFAFTAVVSVGIGAQVHSKEYYYEQARWRLATGNTAGALEDLNLIVSLTPDDSQAYNTRGVIYERCGDYSAARADYERALLLNPDSAEAKHNINNLNEKLKNLNLTNAGAAPPAYRQPVQQGAYATAQSVPQQGYAPVQSVQQQIYTPARSVQPVTYGSSQTSPYTVDKNFLNMPAANYYRAGMDIGMFRQTGTPAVNAYGRALQPAAFHTGVGAGAYEWPMYKTPVNKTFIDVTAENCNNYGVMLNSSGRFEEAVLKFTEATEIYPGYAIAYNNRGVAYAALGDFVRATEDFTKALRLNPYYYDAQVNYKRINGNLRVVAITQ
jgi:tetratricopeptide (TPR) repeat protein